MAESVGERSGCEQRSTEASSEVAKSVRDQYVYNMTSRLRTVALFDRQGSQMLTNQPRRLCLSVIAAIALPALGLMLWRAFHPADRQPRSVEHAAHSSQQTSGLESLALRQRVGREGPLFERLTANETGVDFTNALNDDTIWSEDFRTVLNGSIGSGPCVGDYDNDGRADIYLVGRASRNKLFRQVGDFRFEDVTEVAGVDGGDGTCAGAAFADIDNDGDLDLYLCKYDAPNLLYINQGDQTFVEAAKSYGLDFHGSSVMASFSDFDRDGDLDLYLLTNRLFISTAAMQTAQRKIKKVAGRPLVPPEVEEIMYFTERQDAAGKSQFFAVPAGQHDHLFRNDGNGTFSDVSRDAGIDGCFRGHSATWWDFNADGWPDLYVSNDFFDPDQLYRNDGDGTFTEVAQAMLPHTPWFSMGADFADINNDGWFDLLAADMSATTHFKQKLNMGSMSEQQWFLESAEPRQYMRNAVYLNTGTDRFMEVAYLTGLNSTDWTWAVKFCDMDNDGRTDVYFTNGMIRNTMDSDLRQKGSAAGAQGNRLVMGALLRESEPLKEANIAFRNRGELQFEDISSQWGLGDVGISCSAVFADLDQDGDQDLVVNNYNQPVSIYRNQGDQGHSVQLRLRGTCSNRFGIGAVAKIETDSGMQVKRLSLARGYMSGEEAALHFGLGEETNIQKLTLQWPSGHVQEFDALAADRIYVISEPRHSVTPSHRREGTVRPLFHDATPLFDDVTADVKLEFRHIERTFDDFAVQPLLPYRLSRLGAGLAWGDADGDGNDDLFLGGAAGQSGQLYLNADGGRSLIPRSGPWQDDAEHEDMAPLWFDADQDGDLDLFVTSGSVEFQRGDPLLSDRLYLNDGQARFRKAPSGTLPDLRESSGVAAAADFDQDGDLDLFVGGRVVPGKYPLSPHSALLRNDQGKFVEVTDRVAPGLRKAGLVTGAIWSDADDDGRPDLLVTIEWGPVRLFHNTGGQLVEQTREAGLADHLGWWNAIAGGDLDGDGDIDYAVTNVGRNTKYHADTEHPTLLYYGDFDGQGKNRLVEASFEEDQLFPGRGRSCSTSAIPSLATKFPTFSAFAAADLNAVYSAQRLANALRMEANHLDSVVLINLGDGRFNVTPLPVVVQAAPGFGVAITDFDGDGANDVYVVQNFFSPQPETGRMDGGLSVLLKGDGDGNLLPVSPIESGLLVPGDAKGLAITDLDQDGWPDIAITHNDQPTRLLRNGGRKIRSSLGIRLVGKPGNPTAVGARVTVTHEDGNQQTAEVYAGSGYLSQSSPVLFFGRGTVRERLDVNVRWPDGKRSTHEIEPADDYVILSYPDLRASIIENVATPHSNINAPIGTIKTPIPGSPP